MVVLVLVPSRACINLRGSDSSVGTRTSCMFQLSVSRSFQHSGCHRVTCQVFPSAVLCLTGAGFKDEKKCAKKGSGDILLSGAQHTQGWCLQTKCGKSAKHVGAL